MTDDHDPLREALRYTGEVLAAPLHAFDTARRRAARRTRLRALGSVAAAAVVVGTVAVAAGVPGRERTATPLVEVTASPTPLPTAAHTPTPTPTPMATPAPSGLTWSTHSSGVPGGFAGGLSCPTTTFCAAAVVDSGRSGLAVYDGTSWSATWEPSFAAQRASVSCASATACVAVVPDALTSAWDGTRWSSPERPPVVAPGADEAHVACSPTGSCLAVLGRGDATSSLTWDGRSWTASRLLRGTVVTALACPSAVLCVAGGTAGGDDVTLTWTPAGWSAPAVLAGGPDHVAALACGSTTACMVVGGVHASGDVYATWTGGAWTPWQRLGTRVGSLGFASVSCPTSRDCVVADQGAGANSSPETSLGPLVLTWHAGTWTSTYQQRGTIGQPDVSCSSLRSCVAVSAFGDLADYLTGTG